MFVALWVAQMILVMELFYISDHSSGSQRPTYVIKLHRTKHTHTHTHTHTHVHVNKTDEIWIRSVDWINIEFLVVMYYVSYYMIYCVFTMQYLTNDRKWVKGIQENLFMPFLKNTFIKQNGIVLAEKQTHGPVEKNQESRNKRIFIWANNFLQKSQKHTVEKGKPL